MLRRGIGVVAAALGAGLATAYVYPRVTARTEATPVRRASLPETSEAPGPPHPVEPPARIAALPHAAQDDWPEPARSAMRAVHGRFATGDFVGAQRLADDYALDSRLGAAFQAWLAAQMQVLLTSAGWAQLKVGDCEAAMPLLRRAEAIKRDADTAKGLGVCHYKLRQMSAAREQLTWYAERRPDDHQVPILLADALESESRYEEAVKILEQLAQQPCAAAPADREPTSVDCPSPAALAQRLTSMRARAKESWNQQQETSRNFHLSYHAGDHEELVAYVLQELEDALDEYVDSYGFRLPPSPIEVALYPAGDFRNVVAGGPEWAEGLFDGRIRIPVRDELLQARRYDGLRIVLRHELVHALLAAMSDHRNLPPWLDEGLAQALACRPSCVAPSSFPLGGFLELASFQASYLSFSPLKAGRAYRQSLYLVQALVARSGDDVLRQIISAVTATTELSSDTLLTPAGISFQDLHAYGARQWAKRIQL